MWSLTIFWKGVADGPDVELLDMCTAARREELLEARNLPYYIRQYGLL